jgi:hypothetical protein
MADPPSDGSTEKIDRAVLAVAVAASVALLAALWRVDYLPTHDGPQHVFLGHLENHLDDHGEGWNQYLERSSAMTALGFNILFSFMERLAPWRTALRLTLSATLLLWGWGYLGLTAALHPRRAVIGLLGFASAFSWALYMGFFSYVMSLGLGFATLAAGAAGWPWTPARRAVIGALLLIQVVAHAFSAELTGVVLLGMVMLGPTPRGRLRELGLLALMGLPAMLIAARTRSVEAHPLEWLALGRHLTTLPRTFVPGPVWRAWPPILLGLAGVALAVGRARRREASRAELALLGAGALCLTIGFTAPMHLPTWEFFAPRFLPAGCLFAAALLPVERLDAARRRAALAGLGLITAASIGWAAHANAAMRARVDEALSGLSAPLHRRGPRLFVPMDPYAGLTEGGASDGADEDIPYYAPLFNIGGLYAVAQGGVPPYTFLNNPTTHPFLLTEEGQKKYPEVYDPTDLRDPLVATDPARRRALMTFLAGVGASFEDLVLDGRAEDGDLLVTLGYAPDFRRGGLFMGSFKGCPVDVEVITEAPRPATVFVEYGFEPLSIALSRATLPAEKTAPRGATESIGRVTPVAALCGPTWLRVTLDLDRSRGPSRGDRYCEGADRAGRLHVMGVRGAKVVCRMTPPAADQARP